MGGKSHPYRILQGLGQLRQDRARSSSGLGYLASPRRSLQLKMFVQYYFTAARPPLSGRIKQIIGKCWRAKIREGQERGGSGRVGGVFFGRHPCRGLCHDPWCALIRASVRRPLISLSCRGWRAWVQFSRPPPSQRPRLSCGLCQAFSYCSARSEWREPAPNRHRPR